MSSIKQFSMMPYTILSLIVGSFAFILLTDLSRGLSIGLASAAVYGGMNLVDTIRS
jgi:hypothetical protein